MVERSFNTMFEVKFVRLQIANFIINSFAMAQRLEAFESALSCFRCGETIAA